MICQICNLENPDDAVVCGGCGSNPTLAPPSVATPTMRGQATRPPAPQASLNLVGTVVAGRYEIRGVLGKGGMGIVYRAVDRELHEEIAIKLMQGSVMGDERDRERLKREIVTARRITHPNVIRIHDFETQGEEGFVSMEVLPGGTLAERLARGALPVAEALEIAIGVCDGLAAAHARGIIHRDLKPQNILFDADGVPKIVDFGLARIANATSQTIGFSGTPLYMSPEMTDGREITTRSDVYSLGVMLYELFCGVPPFKADTLMRLAMMHARETAKRPRELRPDLPPAIESVLDRMLEKEPERRYANAREAGEALRAARDGKVEPVTVRMPDRTDVEAAAASAAAATRPAMPRDSRRTILSVALRSGLVGIAVAIAALVSSRWGGRRPGTTPARSTPAENVVVSTTNSGGIAVTIGDTPTATPPPAATAVAVATPPATPHATPRPTAVAHATHAPATTPKPLPIATPTPKPKATPAAVAMAAPQGTLTVRAQGGFAEVWLDGQRIGDVKDVRDRPVSAGRHRLRFVNAEAGVDFSGEIVVPAGKPVTYKGHIRRGEIVQE